MSTVALKVNRRSAPDLIQFARNIHGRMIASATIFTAPPIEMADFASAIDDLETAQQSTYGGGVSATMARNEKLAVVKSQLTVLGSYVQTVSKGDGNIIDLAGMPIKSRGPRRYDTMAVPDGLKTVILRSGVVGLRWQPVHNAKAFAIEYCPDPLTGTQWERGMYNSGANGYVADLTPGKKYWFRVRAIGSQGLTSDWTEPVCVMAM
jgi:hypothetical protein